MTGSNDDEPSLNKIHKDAEGQYARGLKQSDNSGVASAKPTVITGSEDATVNKNPPASKSPKKDWDLNYDARETNEGDFRG